ncbi:MAG: thiamine-phosphate kinase [Alphaproteobacteria bacterium]|nr:thiamine-phosphate kinase [Alphaproteobacteria bacterium]
MSNTQTEIKSIGEFGLIDFLTKNNETKLASTLVSVGDDAAIIDHYGKQTVISTDMLLEGIHFDLMYFPLKYLGFKAVTVNLSDIYAMNAQPTQILVNVALSNRFSVENMTEFYEGIYEACNEFNVDLVGGDTNSSQSGFIISITSIGEVTPNTYVMRSGAKKGDLIAVTGNLGAAYLGLTLLEREKLIYQSQPDVKPDYENQHYILNRFLRPLPQKFLIDFFEEQKLVPTAMIDISDGLSSELHHICNKSQVGCKIYEEKLPIDQQTKFAASTFNLDPTMCALHGGEDYELLFTIDPKKYPLVEHHPNISVIGYVTDLEDGKKLITKSGKEIDLKSQGFNHL